MGTPRQSVVTLALLLTAGLVVASPSLAQDEPAAIRCYVGDIHDSSDGPAEGAQAVILRAARRGTFSGKVVVASPEAVKGLAATVGDLQSEAGGRIDPANVQVRYGVLWDRTIGNHYRPAGGDILLEEPPEAVDGGRRGTRVPVWITVTVPRDAAPGTYSGALTVRAEGLDPKDVPVTVEVAPWTLPELDARRTWIELLQSPDTLATEYDVPLWSEKHWRMIDRSFQWIAATGSRVVYVPLIARTNQGNAESMVRWVPAEGGGYEYDFTVMERYLDVACKHMGRPKMVVFYVWDIYLKPPKQEVVIKEDDSRYVRMEKTKKQARWELRDKGPAVTTLDRSSGESATLYLVRYDDPKARDLWAPLWQTLRKKMSERGLTDAMMLGTISDVEPSKEETALLKELTGGLPWVSCSHHMRWVNHDPPPTENHVHGMATIAYPAVALDFQYALNPAHGRMFGWKKPVLHAIYWRFRTFNGSTMAWIRGEPECCITGNQRGVGHLGGDFWWTIRDKRGRRVGTVAGRYPESYWHSLNVGSWMLGPGPDGPVGTARLEVLREGLQACEARIAIERVLTDEALKAKIGPQLASEAQALLDDRQRDLWRARGASDDDLEAGLVLYYRDLFPLSKKWNAGEGNAWFVREGWAEKMTRLFTMAHKVEQTAAK